MQNLWMGVDLADAVNHARVHYQLKPDLFYYDEPLPKVVALINLYLSLYYSRLYMHEQRK